ncbi:MAG TPA: hypothetical protein VL979_15165 [Solirubrobacteraceae bacterium]|nr:hypothetical protein [Solirubrobacteraceae bacterium]
MRSRSILAVVVALVASLAALSLASQALAKSPSGKYAVFKQCPRFTSGVNLCLYSQTTSGEVTLDKQAVPITNTITLQGGIALNEETFEEKFVGALNGETLSKTPQKVPGGLLGLVKCNEITGSGFFEVKARLECEFYFENFFTGVNAVTELAKPASEIKISTFNLESGEETALTLPVKVHLENVFLGPSCYIGSSSKPIELTLTTGATHPSPPNTSIKGKIGKISAEDEFNFLEITGNQLVSNEFSAPEASGCGGLFALFIDPLINSKLGLPSPDGYNTAIQNNTIREATTEGVIASE